MVIMVMTFFDGYNTPLTEKGISGEIPGLSRYQEITGSPTPDPSPRVTIVRVTGTQETADFLDQSLDCEVLSIDE